MIGGKITDIGAGNQIGGDVNQHIGDKTEYNSTTNIYYNGLPISKKTSIIQEILEGILDLDTKLQPVIPNTTDYTIYDKIKYNEIQSYNKAFDILMQDSFLIEQRLNFLNNQKDPSASQKLYTFIRRIYAKHCSQPTPDLIVDCICNEIQANLAKYPNISDDDAALVPAIVFYVFSKCHIFEKPPMQT